MIHVRHLEVIKAFLASCTPVLVFAILILEKETCRLKLLLLPEAADLFVFRVRTQKTSAFLVGIFCTNLLILFLLKNHGSDSKMVIVNRGWREGKITMVFTCLHLILFLREIFLFARTSIPRLNARVYIHTYR